MVMEQKSRQYKVVLLGDAKVGKTSLRRNYMGSHFQEDHQWTIGADVSFKRLDFKDMRINLNIWDLGGQPNFEQVRKLYYAGTHGILLVFDLTNPATLNSMRRWIEEYKSGNPLNVDRPPIVLLGNKNDLDGVVVDDSIEEAKQLLLELLDRDVFFLRTSAKTGENVVQAFENLTEQILKLDM